MAAVTIELKTKDLLAGIDRLQAGVPQAMARALNRAIVTARAELARATAADMGLKVGVVKDAIVTREATADNPVASLYASKQRIPLIEFNARGPEPSRGRGNGVSYRLPGGRVANAFIAAVGNGHRGVFIRASVLTRKSHGAWGANLPIKQLYGPSIKHVAAKHTDTALAKGQESLVKNLQSELRYALRRGAA